VFPGSSLVTCCYSVPCRSQHDGCCNWTLPVFQKWAAAFGVRGVCGTSEHFYLLLGRLAVWLSAALLPVSQVTHFAVVSVTLQLVRHTSRSLPNGWGASLLGRNERRNRILDCKLEGKDKVVWPRRRWTEHYWHWTWRRRICGCGLDWAGSEWGTGDRILWTRLWACSIHIWRTFCQCVSRNSVWWSWLSVCVAVCSVSLWSPYRGK
jgi:hypothetical protein